MTTLTQTEQLGSMQGRKSGCSGPRRSLLLKWKRCLGEERMLEVEDVGFSVRDSVSGLPGPSLCLPAATHMRTILGV